MSPEASKYYLMINISENTGTKILACPPPPSPPSLYNILVITYFDNKPLQIKAPSGTAIIPFTRKPSLLQKKKLLLNDELY